MNGSSNAIPDQSQHEDRFVTSHGSTVLYRGIDTIITTAFFESAGRRYPVAELILVRKAEQAGWAWARRFELWAQIRGRWVPLFQSRDEREFGQVCRALTRAREYAGLA